mmetsp:Transcript_126326/g.365674  ORF Transcript_126326/g.365674 Transcript_126326/m.365674 type:complete len:361 (-) Transcript_126326:517-1599(-)
MQLFPVAASHCCCGFYTCCDSFVLLPHRRGCRHEPQVQQALLGAVDRKCVWRVQQSEAFHALATRLQRVQDKRFHWRLLHLRLLVGLHALVVILLRIQREEPTGLGSSAAPTALLGRGLRDVLDLQHVQAHGVVVRHLFGLTGVDHKADAVDRQRRLRDVGATDDLTSFSPSWASRLRAVHLLLEDVQISAILSGGPLLVLFGQRGIQRERGHGEVLRLRPCVDLVRTLVDFALPRQEDQHIALLLIGNDVVEEHAERPMHQVVLAEVRMFVSVELEGQRRQSLRPAVLNFVHFAGTIDLGAIPEIRTEALRIDRRSHHHDLQLGRSSWWLDAHFHIASRRKSRGRDFLAADLLPRTSRR